MASSSSRQADEWAVLYEEIRNILKKHGNEYKSGQGDYWLVDDNYGFYQHKVEITALRLLRSPAVRELQILLTDRPDWEIVLGVDVPGTEDIWPAMGLIIRDDEIIDGLKREYFPKEFQDLQYEGSRPGTDRD